MSKRKIRKRMISKNRLPIILFGIVLVFAVLSFRLFYLMLIKGDEYAAMSEAQWTSTLFIDGKRGRILDSNYNEFAVSGEVYRVDLDLTSIRSYIENHNKKSDNKLSIETLAEELGKILDMSPEKVMAKLESKLENGMYATSASLIRQIDKDKADRIKELGITGIIISEDTLRYYINDSLLSHVIGVTDSDGNGLTGLEYLYNDILQGTPGVRIAEVDNYNSQLPYTTAEYTDPIDGKDLVLTIDENIQYIAEKAAETALEKNKANAVTITVMNPNNGEILAVVNKPDYDLNNPRDGAESYEELQKIWRNRAVSDAFEPGSVFKVITAVAALEEGLVSDNTIFYCSGRNKINGTTINCWKPQGHGTQSFSDIIKNSCNSGFIQLGQLIGKETLYEYIKLLGFGEYTGIDLPGEGTGVIMDLENITEIDLATISFGQTNSTTTMQYMAAFNAIANGGTWITPHVLKEVIHTDENNILIVDDVYSKGIKKKVLSEESTGLLRSYLERVVTEGSGTGARIEGYHIAGKTGTAQKVIDGKYAEGKYVSTFVGMTPVDNPELTIMVTIDEPSAGPYYAGEVAAPVANEVLNNIFNYLTLKSGEDGDGFGDNLLKEVVIPEIRGMKKEEALENLKKEGLNSTFKGDGNIVSSISPVPGNSVKKGTEIVITLGTSADNKDVVVPNLSGYSKQAAKELIEKIGLKAEFSGEGMVIKQSITVNEYVESGTTIKLTLDYIVED
ncbi:stage V sporulation protein D [Alloiococcus sp. CFN-8]|uniref:stage V sporulation protein D n=1 Tax=Alloiococcus sp. CFN-8 TaxID=3416081 RepID=UPI003CF4CEB3